MINNTHIYIVKGGESSQAGVWHGAGTPAELTSQGEKSSANLQSKIAAWGITAAYTSPEKRIIHSAKIALQDSGIESEVSQDLAPRKITPFEGLPGEEIKKLYKIFNQVDPAAKVSSDAVFTSAWGPWVPGAFEINSELRARIKHFTDMVQATHPGENVYVQTHVDWIREAYRLFANAPDTEDYSVTPKTVLHLTFGQDKQLIGIEREEMPNR